MLTAKETLALWEKVRATVTLETWVNDGIYVNEELVAFARAVASEARSERKKEIVEWLRADAHSRSQEEGEISVVLYDAAMFIEGEFT